MSLHKTLLASSLPLSFFNTFTPKNTVHGGKDRSAGEFEGSSVSEQKRLGNSVRCICVVVVNIFVVACGHGGAVFVVECQWCGGWC